MGKTRKEKKKERTTIFKRQIEFLLAITENCASFKDIMGSRI